ncbi:MAG: rhodanese-like domain-containing protein [Chromatiales bacterium]|jgi:rhodanese-related sulfurtransferase
MPSTTHKVILPATLLLLSSLPLASLADSSPDSIVLERIQEYLDFAEYSAGSISTEQLEAAEAGEIVYIDTRNAGQYEAGHIQGAINIEWRQILNRKDEIPTDRTVVLYCETGLLSSKAQFILQLAGYNNVKVLWGGYLVWSAHQSFEQARQNQARQSGQP